MGGGREHQSMALTVLDNPITTLNLSSAWGSLSQAPLSSPLRLASSVC